MLKINNKFRDLIPPLSADEFSQLEKNIMAQGCRDAIITWRGVIIDGHNRYNICTKHGISYKTEEMSFGSRKKAILWIAENQLGRRNLSTETRIALTIKATGLKSRKDIAKYADVSEYAVQKYMKTNKNKQTVTSKTIRKIATPKDLEYADIWGIINKAEGYLNFILKYFPSDADEELNKKMLKVVNGQSKFFKKFLRDY